MVGLFRMILLSMQTKAAIYMHSHFEEVEAVTVIDLLRRANFTIDILGIEGLSVTGSHGIVIRCDLLLSEALAAKKKYDIHILPGGPGIENLQANQPFIDLVKEWGQQNFKIAAICAAPKILAKAGLLAGRRITCFPAAEASITEARIAKEAVVKEGNLITSRGVGTAIPFALAIIEELLGAEIANRIAKEILFV